MKVSNRKVIIVLACWLVLIIASAVFAQDIVIRVRGVPQIVDRLAGDVVFLLGYKQTEINWDQTHISNLPAGSTVRLENDATMLREDWLTKADQTIADLQARIDAINALR